MKTNETYQQWLPLTDLSGQVIIEEVTDTDDGLAITIRAYFGPAPNERRAKILFDGYGVIEIWTKAIG